MEGIWILIQETWHSYSKELPKPQNASLLKPFLELKFLVSLIVLRMWNVNDRNFKKQSDLECNV